MPETIFNFERIVAQGPWVLALDIILTIVLFYQIFLTLRGSKAIPLLNGLGVLFIASLISDWVRLTIFSSLLKYILGILVIAIPVLFQPELRRALGQLGRRNLLARFLKLSPLPPPLTLQAITTAATEMAEEKVGGLIVLERETSLEEIIETGIRLDALVSAALIQQIFAKHTPLHDGAMVIRGNRLLAAGCLLPLSTSKNLPPGWGTRHRAGVGLSEISDAIVVVVSEEHASITLSNEGQWRRISDKESLQRELEKLMVVKERSVTDPARMDSGR